MFTEKKRLIKTLFICTGVVSFIHASVPNAPGYVGATKIKSDETNTSVRISFEDKSTDEDKFYISVHNYTDDMPFATIEVDSTNGNHGYANITGLTCDKTYQAVVVAHNQDGNSSESDTTTFNIKTTFNATCGDTPPSTVLQPGPYIGVTAIDEDNTSAVRISLKDNSNNEDGFRIFDGADINVTISQNDENSHPYVYANLTGLTCTKLYSLQAVSFKDEVESLPTPVRTFKIESTLGIDCNEDNSPVPESIDPTTLIPEFD